MTPEQVIEKLRAVKTMPELDELRIEVVRAWKGRGEEVFKQLQAEFIKQKNRLKRIPLRDRTW